MTVDNSNQEASPAPYEELGRLADPHQKGPLTTPVGRLIERASYLDLLAAGLVTLLLSTAYFSLAPADHSLGEKARDVSDAAYFSVVTFTSLGYGDLSPKGIGRVVAILVVLVGLALIALLVGKFASERQQTLLLLLHTSDCQRRLNDFTSELALLSDRLTVAAASRDVQETQIAAKVLSHRIEVVRNYLVFNANQARLIEFGNESSLIGLYNQLSKVQRVCIGLHRSESADLLVSRRTRSVAGRCLGLVRLLRTFHAHAEQKTSYLGALFRAARPMWRNTEPAGSSSLAMRVGSIHKAMQSEAEVLEKWGHSARTPMIFEAVWLRSPAGEPATWPTGVHKIVAQELSISNRLAQSCLDELLQAGRLPKANER